MGEDLPYVIQIKLNQLVQENVHVIINLPKKRFKWQQSSKHSQEFYPQDGGENQLA